MPAAGNRRERARVVTASRLPRGACAATMVMSMVRPLLGRRGPAVEGIDQGLRLLITTASSSPGPRRRGTVAHGGEPSVPARCELAQSSTAL